MSKEVDAGGRLDIFLDSGILISKDSAIFTKHPLQTLATLLLVDSTILSSKTVIEE